MTLEEWVQVRAAINLAWENARQLTDDELEGQFRLFPWLSKIGRDLAVEAVVEIASSPACGSCRSAPRFPPGPGEIIARVQSKPMTSAEIAEAVAASAERREVEKRKARQRELDGVEPA